MQELQGRTRRRFFEGQKYGSWTIIEYPVKSKKVLLRCDCGTEGWYWISNLSSNKSTRCNKCTVTTAEVKTYKSVLRTAARRGISWNLTFEQWLEIALNNCYYCGAQPSNLLKRVGLKYNGVDRVDSALGYSIDNCVTACRVCNRAKSDTSQKEFYEWIRKVYDYKALSQ